MGILTSDISGIAIEFDDADTEPPYKPLEMVTGTIHVIVDKDEPVKIKQITLKLLGRLQVSWTETSEETHVLTHDERHKMVDGSVRSGHQVERKNNIDFWTQTVLLEEEKILAKGQTKYPFHFKLPLDARTSFQGEFGSVKYTAGVNVNIPWGRDGNATVEFSVMETVDLNQYQKTAEKVTLENWKRFGTLCCESGPLHVTLHLNKTGFVAGELIHIKAEVNNKSNKRIGSVLASLLQMVTYASTNGFFTKIDQVPVMEGLNLGAVSPGYEEVLEETIRVPNLPPTRMDKSAIGIQYCFNLDADPDGTGFDLSLGPVLMTIGTIPHKVAAPPHKDDSAPDVEEMHPNVPNA